MANVLELVSLVIETISLTTTAYSVLATSIDSLLKPARQYRQRRFGLLASILESSLFLDAESVQELHRNINLWGDEQLRAWKESYINSCNAIAVAGAIFASIGLTALQLPAVGSIHWIVRAFFASSMLLGIFSVVSATSQHREIGLQNDPIALRLWLSKGKPAPSHVTRASNPYPHPYDTLPLESSVSAALVLQFPRVLLNQAVFLYLAGFVSYLLLSWIEEVPDGSNDYRNIFIFFVISAGPSFLYYGFCLVDRLVDAATVAQQFHFERLGHTLDRSDESNESNELKSLETTLKGLRNDKDLVAEVNKLTLEISKLTQAMQRAAVRH